MHTYTPAPCPQQTASEKLHTFNIKTEVSNGQLNKQLKYNTTDQYTVTSQHKN